VFCFRHLRHPDSQIIPLVSSKSAASWFRQSSPCAPPYLLLDLHPKMAKLALSRRAINDIAAYILSLKKESRIRHPKYFRLFSYGILPKEKIGLRKRSEFCGQSERD